MTPMQILHASHGQVTGTVGPGTCIPGHQAHWKGGAAWTKPLTKSFALRHKLANAPAAPGAIQDSYRLLADTSAQKLVANQQAQQVALHNTDKGTPGEGAETVSVSEQESCFAARQQKTSQWASKSPPAAANPSKTAVNTKAKAVKERAGQQWLH